MRVISPIRPYSFRDIFSPAFICALQNTLMSKFAIRIHCPKVYIHSTYISLMCSYKYAFKIHCLSYCTMDGMNSTMESYCLLLSFLSYCTMERMDSTMESYCLFIHYPTVHPILLYHGQNGQYNGILLTISYYPSHPIVPWTG